MLKHLVLIVLLYGCRTGTPGAVLRWDQCPNQECILECKSTNLSLIFRPYSPGTILWPDNSLSVYELKSGDYYNQINWPKGFECKSIQWASPK